jgi:predicted phage tail protein
MKKLRKLYLYGALEEKFGKEHDVFASTFTEAIGIVNCNHKTFKNTVKRGMFHCVKGKDIETGEELTEKEVLFPTANDNFHLIPEAYGRGQGKGTGKMILSIVVGGALLATGIGGAFGAASYAGSAGAAAGASGASLLAGGFAATAGGLAGVLGLSYGSLALLGASLFLGGISQLLSPQPQVATDSTDGGGGPTSFTFNTPANIAREGGPVPLVYGKNVRCGGVIIASAIESSRAGNTLETLPNFGASYDYNSDK